MPSWLFSPLAKYALITLAVVSFIGGVWLSGRHSGVKSMQAKVEAAQSEAELWKKSAETRKTLIEAQNQAIDSIKAESDTKVAEMNKRLATAILEGRKSREAAEKKAESILTVELPKNECNALFTLIDTARGL